MKKNPAHIDEYVKSFIASVDDIVFELGNDGRIVKVWAQNESKFWVQQTDFMNKKIKDAIPGELGKKLQQAFLQARETQQPVVLEYQSLFDTKYYSCRMNAIKNLGADKRHVSAVVRDITDRKNAEIEMEAAKKTAEEALLAKNHFLSSVSHEIRTPMNAIIGLTDILVGHTDNETCLDYLNSIKYASTNLLALIDDILDLSRIELGKTHFFNTNFDLHKELVELRKIHYLKATEKGIRFKNTIDDKLPQFVKGDPRRLNQVLSNLISNAVKFTDKGEVELQATLLKMESERIQLRFSVLDTGIGISPDMLELIFEPFQQVPSETTNNTEGTGLGLAISKKIIEQQGGNIAVKSQVGKGSEFVVNLSFSQPDSLLIPAHGGLEDEDLKGMCVLVAEDNRLNQLVIKKNLEKWNAVYHLVGNGQEALEILKTKPVDVVLMDLHMPQMDGYQTAQAIRAGKTEGVPSDIPIVALTADAYESTKEKVQAAGMNDFVTKPFQKKILLEVLKKYH